MPYDGAILQRNDLLSFDFRCTFIVFVSPDACELADHVLLNTHDQAGHYCHVAGVHDRPRMLNDTEYRSYLAQKQLRELGRSAVLMRHPSRALAKLEALLAKPASFWRPTRGAAFAEMVLRAGGSSMCFRAARPRAFGSAVR